MEKIKKRLIIFMPSIDGGGVEKNLFIISNFLSSKLNEIVLITFDSRFNKKFDNKIRIINVVKKPKKKYSKYYKYYKCLKILIYETIRKESLVFAFQANIYCCFLSIIFNFDLITRSNSSPTGWSKNFFKNLIFKILFKIPKKIIVNSKDFKSEIDKKFNIKTKLIYNPLNIKTIKESSSQKLNFNFFNNSKIKAINVARFTDQKDHITLLESIKYLVSKKIDIKLLIMGYGPNKKEILNYIKRQNLSKNIKIINFQNNPYKYMYKSNLFILSSLYEGLPNVLLEAMTLKKFIISSNCPTGPREILKNGSLGYMFQPKDSAALSKLILKFYNNKIICKNISKKAYTSLNRFDYKTNCYKYYKVIREFI